MIRSYLGKVIGVPPAHSTLPGNSLHAAEDNRLFHSSTVPDFPKHNISVHGKIHFLMVPEYFL